MALEESDLRRVAEGLGHEWEALGTHLGFSHAEIYHFRIDGTNRGIVNVMFDMLVTWKERQPNVIDFRHVLGQALEKSGHTNLADHLLNDELGATIDLTKRLGETSSSVIHRDLSLSDVPSDSLRRAFARRITVEPIVFLVAIAINIVATVQPRFLRERLPNDDPPFINGTCGLPNPIPDMSFWQILIPVCAYLPATVTAPFLGAWSDTIGRKVIIGLATLGYFVTSLTYLFVFYFALPLWIIPVVSVIQGITGGYGLILAGCISYITDITTKEKRLTRVSIVYCVFVIGIRLSKLGILSLIGVTGFGPPLLLASASLLASLVYIAIPPCLIKIVNTNRQQESKNDATNYKSKIYSLVELSKNNSGRRRWRLGILFTIEFLSHVLNANSVFLVILYGLGPEFCWWNDSLFVYLTLVVFGSAVAIGVATKALSLCLSDLWVLQVGMVFGILNGLLIAFAKTTIGLYVVSFIGSLRAIRWPIIPFILSKMVTSNEYGAVFGIEASVLNLGSLVSTLLLNSIYSATAEDQPNGVFIIVGVLGIIPVISTGVLQIVTRRTHNQDSILSSDLNEDDDLAGNELAGPDQLESAT